MRAGCGAGEKGTLAFGWVVSGQLLWCSLQGAHERNNACSIQCNTIQVGGLKPLPVGGLKPLPVQAATLVLQHGSSLRVRIDAWMDGLKWMLEYVSY
jgi:hypothetical protein